MKRLIKAVVPRRFHSRLGRIQHELLYSPGIFARRRPRFMKMEHGIPDVLECCITYNRYGGYCIPLSSLHRPASQRTLRGNVHEPRTIEFLTSHCKDGDIVHAGAYFGDFLPALSRACAPGAKVWAFEPLLENFRCAQMTISINGLTNVELEHAGLGEREDSLIMVTIDENGRPLGDANRIIRGGTATASSTTEGVRVVAIDEIVPRDRNVSIIHLDVEGHEQQALMGAEETIRRCAPIIVAETWQDEGWTSETLVRHGYRPAQELHMNTVFVQV